MNNINFNYSNNTIIQNISQSECLYNSSFISQLNCTQLIFYMDNYSTKCNNELMKNMTDCIKEDDGFSFIPFLIFGPCILVCTCYILACLYNSLKELCNCLNYCLNDSLKELCNCIQYSYCCLIRYTKICIIGKSQINNINLEEDLNNYNYNIKSGVIVLPDNNSNKDIICAICMDQLFNDNTKILNLECNHKFHIDCLFHWIQASIDNNNNINCPICRNGIIILFK